MIDSLRGPWADEPGTDPRRTLFVDLVFYGICAVDAVGTAAGGWFYSFRTWGNYASFAYWFAVLHTLVMLYFAITRRPVGRWGSRWVPVGVIAVVGMIVPQIVLLFVRLGGQDFGSQHYAMNTQPEVWIIERSARLLLDTGSPYVDIANLGRPPEIDDYTPYGPGMALFGLPRAVFGTNALTDARVWFALFSVAVLVLAWLVARKPTVSVRSVQLVGLFTLATLWWAVAGDDLPVIALLILAAALISVRRPEWSAIVVALAVSMKLTALPMIAVLVVAYAALRGRTHVLRFLGATALALAVFHLPYLANPEAFVENVIRFPANLAAVESPAGSPLPGHVLSSTGSLGHAIVFLLLAASAVAMLAWLVLRPPRTAAEILVRVAVGLAVAMMLMPATRWGYLSYPLGLYGAALSLRHVHVRERPPREAEPVTA